MIKITAELHSAITREVSTIGEITIANTLTSFDEEYGNYDVKVDDTVVYIRGHERAKSFWLIVLRALRTLEEGGHYE